jgi:hypothetical protein
MWRRNKRFPNNKDDSAIIEDSVFRSRWYVEDGVNWHCVKGDDSSLVSHGMADTQVCARRQWEKADNEEHFGRGGARPVESALLQLGKDKCRRMKEKLFAEEDPHLIRVRLSRMHLVYRTGKGQ